MLLQTNSYVVPKDRRSEHARLVRRFRQVLARLGCDQFEVYEQTGSNWGAAESSGRFVQIMRFRDRRHQQQVQQAERTDPAAQALIQEFCELINFPYQQQQGLFAVGYYTSALPTGPARPGGAAGGGQGEATAAAAPAASPVETPRPSEDPALSGLASAGAATPARAPVNRPPAPHAPEAPAESGLSALEDLPVENLPDDVMTMPAAGDAERRTNGEYPDASARPTDPPADRGPTGELNPRSESWVQRDVT